MTDLIGVGQLVVLRHVAQIGDGTSTEHFVSILLGLSHFYVVEVELRSEAFAARVREVEVGLGL